MAENNNLFKENEFRDIFIDKAISHLISYIPGVGDFVTITSDSLAQREMMRLDETLTKVQRDIEGIELELATLDLHQQESFLLLYEQFAQQVMRELYENKREAYKNYLVSIIKGFEEKDKIIDEEIICLDILGRMSHIDVEVLKQVMDSPRIDTQTIEIDSVSSYIITGSVNNLASFGLLMKNSRAFFSTGVEAYEVSLTSFGEEFVKYCLKN